MPYPYSFYSPCYLLLLSTKFMFFFNNFLKLRNGFFIRIGAFELNTPKQKLIDKRKKFSRINLIRLTAIRNFIHVTSYFVPCCLRSLMEKTTSFSTYISKVVIFVKKALHNKLKMLKFIVGLLECCDL